MPYFVYNRNVLSDTTQQALRRDGVESLTPVAIPAAVQNLDPYNGGSSTIANALKLIQNTIKALRKNEKIFIDAIKGRYEEGDIIRDLFEKYDGTDNGCRAFAKALNYITNGKDLAEKRIEEEQKRNWANGQGIAKWNTRDNQMLQLAQLIQKIGQGNHLEETPDLDDYTKEFGTIKDLPITKFYTEMIEGLREEIYNRLNSNIEKNSADMKYIIATFLQGYLEKNLVNIYKEIEQNDFGLITDRLREEYNKNAFSGELNKYLEEAISLFNLAPYQEALKRLNDASKTGRYNETDRTEILRVIIKADTEIQAKAGDLYNKIYNLVFKQTSAGEQKRGGSSKIKYDGKVVEARKLVEQLTASWVKENVYSPNENSYNEIVHGGKLLSQFKDNFIYAYLAGDDNFKDDSIITLSFAAPELETLESLVQQYMDGYHDRLLHFYSIEQKKTRQNMPKTLDRKKSEKELTFSKQDVRAMTEARKQAREKIIHEVTVTQKNGKQKTKTKETSIVEYAQEKGYTQINQQTVLDYFENYLNIEISNKNYDGNHPMAGIDNNFHGGKLGQNAEMASKNALQLFSYAGMDPGIDEETLTNLIINCNPNFLPGTKSQTFLETFFSLLGGVLMFDGAGEVMMQVAQQSVPKNLQLFNLNGIFIPASYILSITYEHYLAVLTDFTGNYNPTAASVKITHEPNILLIDNEGKETISYSYRERKQIGSTSYKTGYYNYFGSKYSKSDAAELVGKYKTVVLDPDDPNLLALFAAVQQTDDDSTKTNLWKDFISGYSGKDEKKVRVWEFLSENTPAQLYRDSIANPNAFYNDIEHRNAVQVNYTILNDYNNFLKALFSGISI